MYITTADYVYIYSHFVASPPGGVEGIIPMSLQLLNLEENQLSDWSELLRLKQLPR